ncbi:MAG TPA: hypothetical protein P5561_02760 [Candidatus Omnitrophota bacterium]|nr:hypothetical protein [Candidatus Omnitrophota bacterium]HRY85435.1 hypothetical protein [Candidatus Omnitrophota bacterium]
MDTKRRFRKDRKGFILLTTYLIVTLVSLFSLAYFTRGNVFLQASERNRNKIVAFNMAEAAVDFAVRQLVSNPNYTGTATFTPLNSGSAQGGYTVTVSTPLNNSRVRIIQANGFAPDNNTVSRAYQASSITTYFEFSSNPLFNFAIFAADSVNLTGSGRFASVDSYDSRTGQYASGSATSNGDIGVNSIAAGSITLGGQTIVKGDVLIGPGGNPSTAVTVGPNATITGTQSTSAITYTHPTPSTSVPSSGALELTGGTTILMPGTYHYSSLKVSGQGVLQASGPVTIYVDGAVELTGQSVVSQNNLPKNFLIYVIGSQTVTLAGQTDLYGAIYAPNAEVQNSGNAAVFGAVVAKKYTQTGNASIHFDQALTEVANDQSLGTPRVRAWQEQNSLTWGT